MSETSNMPSQDPSDMDVAPEYELGFRRGYINGMYDAMKSVRSRLSDEEYERLREWITDTLQPWTTTNLAKAVRPPPPNDVAFWSRGSLDDGPFSLPDVDQSESTPND